MEKLSQDIFFINGIRRVFPKTAFRYLKRLRELEDEAEELREALADADARMEVLFCLTRPGPKDVEWAERVLKKQGKKPNGSGVL